MTLEHLRGAVYVEIEAGRRAYAEGRIDDALRCYLAAEGYLTQIRAKIEASRLDR